MKKYLEVMHAVVVVMAICLLVLGAVMMIPAPAKAASVPEGHVGIVIKWSKAQDETLSPGFYFTNPFTTSVKLMDMRWQKYTTQTSAFSKDIQQVDITVSMSYQIQTGGALRLYKEVGMDYADKIMLPRLLDALKSTFARYSAEELVANRERISREVKELLSEQLLFYKLEVREIAIEDIDFTDAYTNAIEAKQVATQKMLQVETEQEQQTLVEQAEAERARIRTEAAAEQKLISAKADAEAVKIAADAEAYRLEMESKNITDNLIRKETIEKWDGKLPTITGADAVPLIDVEGMEGDV